MIPEGYLALPVLSIEIDLHCRGNRVALPRFFLRPRRAKASCGELEEWNCRDAVLHVIGSSLALDRRHSVALSRELARLFALLGTHGCCRVLPKRGPFGSNELVRVRIVVEEEKVGSDEEGYEADQGERARFLLLVLRARGSYASCVRRDARYLRWKYLACPFREYRVLEARRAGTLSGFAVIRDEGQANFRRGVIADLFCDTTDLPTQDALLAAALANFAERRLVRAEAYCFNDRLGAAFRRHGFRSGTTAVQYCVAYRGTPDGKGGPQTVLDNLANWNLFLGDGDLDRA